MKRIAVIHTDLKEKFGIPRQSGLVEELKGTIVFEEEYRIREAVRGLEEFSHIWVIWNFSEAERAEWSPTVRPPKLGGNQRVGVFATRSPFRPNPIGLSCLRLESIEYTKVHGPVLHVSGVDMLDQTPIYDIKPYLPYADSKPDAKAGFTDNIKKTVLKIEDAEGKLKVLEEEKKVALCKMLELDPRPGYKKDADSSYFMKYDEFEVEFKVYDGILSIIKIRN